jgi:hypothetical protein
MAPWFAVMFTPHTCRRLQFAASSDALLHWLIEECWDRGLVRLAELLEDLLIERQAQQPQPLVDPELEALRSPF